jgi:DNA mismatch endonuclease (patch repair protein)
MPSTRTKFWNSKIERNRERDAEVSKALRKSGWKVLRIWEHDLQKKHRDSLIRKLSFLAKEARSPAGTRETSLRHSKKKRRGP